MDDRECWYVKENDKRQMENKMGVYVMRCGLYSLSFCFDLCFKKVTVSYCLIAVGVVRVRVSLILGHSN